MDFSCFKQNLFIKQSQVILLMPFCVLLHVFLGPCGQIHLGPQGHPCPLSNNTGPELVHVHMGR